MKVFCSVALALVAAVAFTPTARAQCGCCGQQVTAHVDGQGDKSEPAKKVTLTGNILCAKCELNEGTKCQTAIQVTEDGKKVTYYLIDKGTKESYHSAVCGGGIKAGTVTGAVSVKDGKKWITPSKVEYKK